MKEKRSLLKPFWSKLFPSAWILGLALIFLWGIPRFFIVLSANLTGNYAWVSIIFISMWVTPWIFLTKFGRYKIGMVKPQNLNWLFVGSIGGILFCTMIYLLATLLYQESVSNWFFYIAKSYSHLPQGMDDSEKLIYFLIYAFISMVFSPFGEELFYRGIIHECFAGKWGDEIASVVDSTSFSITHLAHFGIVYYQGTWNLLLLPSMLWMTSLFFSSQLFYYIRKKSGSILGAILTHSAFNLAMMYFIFYHII